MPKWNKKCQNFPLHDEWSRENIDYKVINLRRHGLTEICYLFVNIKQELCSASRTPKEVTHVCTACLEQCLKQPIAVKHLTQSQNEIFKKKLQLLLGKPYLEKDLHESSSDVVSSDVTRSSYPSAIYESAVRQVHSPDDVVAEQPYVEQHSSQFSSESTITLSCPSQKMWLTDSDDTQESKIEKGCQTDEGVFILKSDFDDLVLKASKYVSYKDELNKLRTHFANSIQNPEMNADEFEKLCARVGAAKLFSSIYDAMCLERISSERRSLNKLRAMVIIYIMMYSQSQRANWFQIALSRTLQQFGITEQGLTSLRNLGIAAHPHTVRAASKSSAANHLSNLADFIANVVDKKQFLVFLIDDYHNIHTKHRPEEKTQTQVVHMATLLLKIFPNVEAVSIAARDGFLSKNPVEISSLFEILVENMPALSRSYANNMPDWVVAKYFEPEAQRHRLLVHDYQQTEVSKMRRMDNTVLVDSIQLPLKSCDDLRVAFEHMLVNGLDHYLNHFLVPFVGDWPTQFFMRQIVYSDQSSLPSRKSVAPLIGPLHVSLNSRECVVMNFHQIFADMYCFLFGKKAKLAMKPKPWRISLLLEVIYGGWTLIRDMILAVFCQCKDIEFLTLVNLLDNYIPLVLSIYSIVFKGNNLEQYCHSLLRCWVMFMIFQRRHYDKALLIALTTIKHWKDQDHPMFQTMMQRLVAFDEYPVENFHSLLRARTKETDQAEQISFKAKEIDAYKHELHNFKSSFVPPRRFHFSTKKIDQLKVKAAQFLTTKFESINSCPGSSVLLPRAARQRKNVSRWRLPNLFGDQIVTNKVLPLGFTSEKIPNPLKKCDGFQCCSTSPMWQVFQGCGHSFHLQCVVPNVSVCPICQDTLRSKIESLGKAANEAVFKEADLDDETEEDDDSIHEEETNDGDEENNLDDPMMADVTIENQSEVVDGLVLKISAWNRTQHPQQ